MQFPDYYMDSFSEMAMLDAHNDIGVDPCSFIESTEELLNVNMVPFQEEFVDINYNDQIPFTGPLIEYSVPVVDEDYYNEILQAESAGATEEPGAPKRTHEEAFPHDEEEDDDDAYSDVAPDEDMHYPEVSYKPLVTRTRSGRLVRPVMRLVVSCDAYIEGWDELSSSDEGEGEEVVISEDEEDIEEDEEDDDDIEDDDASDADADYQGSEPEESDDESVAESDLIGDIIGDTIGR